MNKIKPVFSFVGSSGSGKTTFIEKLIPILVSKGFKVGAIKHDAHKFQLDKPGKDSFRMKAAGASIVAIAAADKMGIIRTFPDRELTLEEIIVRWFNNMDIIITEGYKKSSIPKFEIYRKENGKNPVCFDKKELLGVITKDNIDIDRPLFDIEDAMEVADAMVTMSNFSQPEIEVRGTDDALFENAIIDIAKGASFLSGSKKYIIQIIEE